MKRFFHKNTGYVIPQEQIMVKRAVDGGKTFTSCNGKRSIEQPKCHIEVCESICPYRSLEWGVDRIASDDGGSEIVVLTKARNSYVHTGCAVAYLKGLAGDVEKDVRNFARRHVLRLMEDCPLQMEHRIYEWSHKRRKRDGQ